MFVVRRVLAAPDLAFGNYQDAITRADPIPDRRCELATRGCSRRRSNRRCPQRRRVAACESLPRAARGLGGSRRFIEGPVNRGCLQTLHRSPWAENTGRQTGPDDGLIVAIIQRRDFDGVGREQALWWTLRRETTQGAALCRMLTHPLGHELRLEVCGQVCSPKCAAARRMSSWVKSAGALHLK